MTVPMPPAVIRIARPEPPTFEHVGGEHDLADVGHADAQHGGGGAAEQRADLRAAGELAHALARLREQGRRPLLRDAAPRRPWAREMPASSTPLSAKLAALRASSPSVGITASSSAAIAGPSVSPRSSIAPNRPIAAGRRSSGASCGSPASEAGREQRGADAGQRGGEDHRRSPSREQQQDEGDAAHGVGEHRAGPPAPPVHERAEQRAEQDGGQQVGQQHGDDRPGGPEAVVREQRQRHVGEPGAEAGLRVREEEAPAGRVRERRAQQLRHRRCGPRWKRRGTSRDPHATCTSTNAAAEDQQVADAVDVVHRPRGRRGDDVAEERELRMRHRRPSCRTRPPRRSRRSRPSRPGRTA